MRTSARRRQQHRNHGGLAASSAAGPASARNSGPAAAKASTPASSVRVAPKRSPSSRRAVAAKRDNGQQREDGDERSPAGPRSGHDSSRGESISARVARRCGDSHSATTRTAMNLTGRNVLVLAATGGVGSGTTSQTLNVSGDALGRGAPGRRTAPLVGPVPTPAGPRRSPGSALRPPDSARRSPSRRPRSPHPVLDTLPSLRARGPVVTRSSESGRRPSAGPGASVCDRRSPRPRAPGQPPASHSASVGRVAELGGREDDKEHASTVRRAGGRAARPQVGALRAARESARMSRPSSASASVRVSGGAIRSTLPYRPPLPTSSPRAPGLLHRPARPRPGPAGRRPAPTSSTRGHQPLAAHLADGRRGRRRGRAGRSAAGCRPSARWPAGRGRAGSRWWPGRPAVASGLPPKVEIELACRPSISAARATTPPIAKPLPTPLAKVMHVRGDAVRLVAPEVLAGPAPAGLHLVGDQQDPVLVEDLLHRAEEAVRRHREAADALDRLGDQAGHVAGGGGLDDVAQVGDAGRDVVGVGQRRGHGER